MEWLQRWVVLRRFRHNSPLGFGLAVANTLVAFALRLWVDPLLPSGFPFLTFFPCVIVTAFLAGAGPGFLCATLSGLLAWYFFVPPYQSFSLDLPSSIALTFYAGIVAVDIVLIHLMQQATSRLAAQREVTAGLLQQQQLMFQELQHRVANNMAFVSSILHLQKRRVGSDPAAAAAAMDEASTRLIIMSRIHRRLYDPASVELPVRQYFEEICADLLEATGVPDIVVRVDMPPLRLDISRLMTLSLLVTEVVTNSLKHAFEGRQGGTITLKLERLASGRMALTISDDGRGLPKERSKPARTTGGLGTHITQGLAQQLEGELIVTSGQGTTTRLIFGAA